MRGRGKKFTIAREGRRSQYQGMVEHVDDGEYREIAVSIHRDRKCVADVYITIDEATFKPVVYVTAGGEGDEDHDIIARPLKSKEEAVEYE